MRAEDRPWHRYYDRPDFSPDRLVAPSMAEMLKAAAAEHGDKPSYSCVLPNGTSATLSFAEIDRHSDAIAFYLREELGLEPGDVVAIQAPNCLGYPVAAYGVMKAGLTLTGINPLYTIAETRHQLSDSGAKVLFVIDLFGDRVKEAIAGTAVTHVVRLSVADFFPPLRKFLIEAALRHLSRKLPAMSVPAIPLAEAIRLGRRRQKGRDVALLREGLGLERTAIYQYTSGTTGRSKGAEITEFNLLANITQQDHFNGERLRAVREERETSLLILPLYHVYALAIGAMHAMRTGTHLVLAPSPRPLVNLKPAFEKFEITMLPGINTLFNELLKQDWFVANPPRSLKLCFSGAAPLSDATRERWEDLTGCRIYEGYGLTEGTCIVTSAPLDGTFKPGTVGIPIPGTEIRILDETGQELPPGMPGEVVVRGPQVMRGYLNRPEETGEAIRDGWLHTGDIGIMDEDGFLRIVDRKKDMLIVSGFNVYPAEVEAALSSHPGVQEVAVVGVPDAKTGEAPIAYVVRRDPALDEQDLRRHAEGELTNYKRPRRYVFVDELPKSPVGKILRRELRDRAKDEMRTQAS